MTLTTPHRHRQTDTDTDTGTDTDTKTQTQTDKHRDRGGDTESVTNLCKRSRIEGSRSREAAQKKNQTEKKNLCRLEK
jgi:hypothetical protein